MHSFRTVAHAATLLGAAWLINGTFLKPAAAQALNPPEFSLLDKNYVDLVSFSLDFELTDVSIGSKDHPLTHTLYSGPLPDTLLGNGFFRDNNYALLNITPITNNQCNNRYVIYGNQTEYFTCTKSYAVPALSGSGSWLQGGTYTRRDGSRIVFGPLGPNTIAVAPQKVVYPDGRVLTYGWCASGPMAGAICSVTRSDGLQLKYVYGTSNGYSIVSSVIAINNAYEYCDPTAPTCTLSNAWPTVTYTWGGQAPGVGYASILTVTDPAGRQTRYTQDSKGRTVGIKLPSSASTDNLTYSYCDTSSNWCASFNSPYDTSYQNYVQSVVRDGYTWTYSGTPGAGSSATGTCGLGVYTVTNPAGGTQVATQNYCFTDSAGRRQGSSPGRTPFMSLQMADGTVYSAGGATPPTTPFSSQGLTHTVIKPEGNLVSYTWDNRRNITQIMMTPKSGSPLPSVTTSADYSTDCTTSPVTCNEPNYVIDGNGNRTDYTYDTTHGGMLTKTLPPDANGFRPQTRYTYTQRYAWVKSSSGAYVQSAAPIWVRATQSFCRTTAAATPPATGCSTAADEVVTTYEYGPDAGPNNLFLRGQAVTADGVTHRTCYGYDPSGNRISETQPDAGLTSCP